MSARYLEMIQELIKRMAGNSFQLKGWSITLSAAVMAFAGSQHSSLAMIAALLAVFGFWYLDAYFLRQERLYRQLFDHVRHTYGEEECTLKDMSLDTTKHSQNVPGVLGTMGTDSLLVFYLPILGVCLIVALLLLKG